MKPHSTLLEAHHFKVEKRFCTAEGSGMVIAGPQFVLKLEKLAPRMSQSVRHATSCQSQSPP
jgi:hypothetical protein